MNTPSPSEPCSDLLLLELLKRARIEPLNDFQPCDVRITCKQACLSLTDDSRRVTPGGCFVAVRGGSVDGHGFVGEAAAAGASAIIIERDVPVPSGVAVVRVADSRVALAKLAAAYFGLCEADTRPLHLIGITGTNGKTTVAWMLRSILQAAGRTTALLGTIEHDLVGRCVPAALTTPGSLEIARLLAEARDHGATHAVLEASSHALEQKRCDGLAFDVCVFTNLSGDHLDYHETMARYADAKRHLFDLRRAGAWAVVNVDDPMGRSLARELEGPVLTYGLDYAEADVRAAVESVDLDGTGETGHPVRFHCKTPLIDESIHLAFVGRHNVSNALAAAAAAEAMGIGADAIREGLEGLSTVPGRLERVETPGRAFSVLVDYAHTDEALATVLEALRRITRGRLICVFGCGGDRDRSKRPRMAAAVARFADVAFVTSDNPRHEDPRAIVDEILTGFDSDARCRVEVDVDRRRAIEAAIAEASAGDTVLIAGKGHETYQLVGDSVLAFDDLAVARSCLSAKPPAKPVSPVPPVVEEVA